MSDKTIAAYFGNHNGYADNSLGLELEMEQVAEVAGEIFGLLNTTEDNSLRHNGLEFISQPITKPEALRFCKDVLHSSKVLWHAKDKRCTERGSIHVHVNMLHRTVDETIRFLRFYCLLEPQFFAEVEHHRRNNIYCVPLMATSMPRMVQQRSLLSMVNGWHKYTALNAKPLSQYGTVEFRHLQATDSLVTIERWLTLIGNLKQAAVDIRDSNLTWEQVLELHQRVFGIPATLLEDLEVCFQEDLVSRQMFDVNTITMRIKEAKKCAA